MSLYFILLVLKQVNLVVVVSISIIHIQKICVSDVDKNINVRVFKLIWRIDKTRHLKWYETCICKCRLDASICNNTRRWNEDECRYKCKESID